MAAVGRGQIKTKETPTGQMFFYPKEVYTADRTWAQSEVMKQDQEVEQEQFQSYSVAIGDWV